MALSIALAAGLFAFSLHKRRPDEVYGARIRLGQRLFEDPHLSRDNTIRCASCHRADDHYNDGRSVAQGVQGSLGTRNTPSLLLVSIGHESAFFWDGRRSTLEQAVLDPLTNPVEMGLVNQNQLVQRITDEPSYAQAFQQAFPGSSWPHPAQVAAALAAYVRSLRAPQSALDRYLRGDRTALNAQAQAGLALFTGKADCASCHRLDGADPTLTDHMYHRTGVSWESIQEQLPKLTQEVIARGLTGAALGNRISTHADESQLGRFNVTLDPADIGLFRTPSLREVSVTAPYMHDGSVATLDEAIDREVYYRSLQTGHPMQLSVAERQELKAFLESL